LSLAGVTLMFQKPERRRTLALYTLARLAQARYNSLKAAGRWHFWGSTWPHGDTLLFALSSAQVRESESFQVAHENLAPHPAQDLIRSASEPTC